MKKLCIFLSLLFGFTPSTQPISQNVVYAGTFGTMLGSALLAYKLTNNNSLLIATAAAAGSGFLTYQILSQFTAEGRLARARTKFDYVSRNVFATREFATDKDFFDALSAQYVLSDLPLFNAHIDLVFLIGQARDALFLLDAAKSDGTFDLNIIQQCDILIPRIHRAMSLMTEAVRRIHASDEYIKQVKLYKEMQIAQEKLAVQKQIAQSQAQIANAQTQMAHAQVHQAYNR